MTEFDDFHVRRVVASQLHEIRRRVLRGNNPQSSVADPRDDETSSLHFGGFLGERLVVSASFFPSSSPSDNGLRTYQLRYMATDFDVQGHGWGAAVLRHAEQELRTLGVEQVWANGRDSALGFYTRTGWSVLENSQHLSPETQLPHTVIFKIL